MKLILYLIGLILIFSSCSSIEEYKDVSDNFEWDYDFDKEVYVCHSTETGRKLDGKIILRSRGYLDTNLIFKHLTFFNKGIQQGTDSIFRNDTLINCDNYLNGRKHGEQLKFRDSVKIVSQFQNGIIHGEELTFENNVLVQRTKYELGIKNGFEYEYDLNGGIIESTVYELDTNKWSIPYHSMKEIKIENFADSLISIYEYVEMQRVKFKGVIKVFPSGNNWIWPDEVIHSSKLHSRSDDDFPFGSYYIVEIWGGDGLDQIWENSWFAYSTIYDTNYQFVSLKKSR